MIYPTIWKESRRAGFDAIPFGIGEKDADFSRFEVK
jgi:hypothetical protein